MFCRRARIPFLLAGLLATPILAQSGGIPETAEELLLREATRSGVEEALLTYTGGPARGLQKSEAMDLAIVQLRDIGEDAVPYLVNEIQQQRWDTFAFAAYALGRIGSREAEPALREALARAEEIDTDFGSQMQAWSAYALALIGELEALDLFNSGNRNTAGRSLYRGATMLEVAAFVNAPDSVPVLHRQMERYGNSPAESLERRWVMKGLRRIGDPSSVPWILKLLTDPAEPLRRESALALQTQNNDEAMDGLVAALPKETSASVRYAMARSLEEAAPKNRVDFARGQLEVETNPHVRGCFYRYIAEENRKNAFDLLAPLWKRADAEDRAHLIEAIALLETSKGLPILREALADDNPTVSRIAVAGLVALGGEPAIEAVAAHIKTDSFPRLQQVLGALVNLQATEVAPKLVDRLVEVELGGIVRDPHDRERIYVLADGLLGLRHYESIERIREAASVQTDGELRLRLDDLLAKLELLRDNTDDVKRWIETLKSPDANYRTLAFERLGEIGGGEAARALTGYFGRVTSDEGLEILRALSRVPESVTRELIERVLISEEFDAPDRRKLREMAAWAAWQLGGSDMMDAMRAAIERREGRDAKVMIYHGLLAGKKALPTFDRYRISRMRIFEAGRALEQERLDELTRRIASGRSTAPWETSPDTLQFRPTR